MSCAVAPIMRNQKPDAGRHDGEGLRRRWKTAFLNHVFAAEAPEITADRGSWNDDQAEAVTCAAAIRFSKSSDRELAESKTLLIAMHSGLQLPPGFLNKAFEHRLGAAK